MSDRPEIAKPHMRAMAVAVIVGTIGTWAIRPAPAVTPPRAEPRLDGEYGLFVQRGEGELLVQWFTAEEGPGFFAARAGGEELMGLETPSGLRHTARVPFYGVEEVELQYGSLTNEADRHSTTIWVEPETPEKNPVYEAVDSVFVLGDLHGEFDRVVRILYNSGVIDAEFNWTGGTNHVVMLGDLVDRGEDVTRLLWFTYRLEREAAAAGGRLHVVLGNHEIMVMNHDGRYVNQKEYLLALRHGVDYADLFDPRTSVLGHWLSTKPVVIQIDDLLLTHAGISARYVPYSIEQIQDTLQAFIQDAMFAHYMDSTYLGDADGRNAWDDAAANRRYRFFFDADESLFWYRGWIQESTLGNVLEDLLEQHEAKVLILGHTPVPTIEERYDGRVIAVDLEDPATEMLLMARWGDTWERFRYRLFGPPEPVSGATSDGD